MVFSGKEHFGEYEPPKLVNHGADQQPKASDDARNVKENVKSDASSDTTSSKNKFNALSNLSQ